MRIAPVTIAVAMVLLVACKKGEPQTDGKAGPTATGGSPTAEQCTKAFDHWAEVSAKKSGGTKADKLAIQTGNIASCPKMMSPAGIKCFNDLTEADVATWPTCLGKK